MTLFQLSKQKMSPALVTLVALVAALAAGTVAISGYASDAPTSIHGGPTAANQLLTAQIAKLPPGIIKSAVIASPSPADVAAGVPDRGNNWLWVEAVARDRSDAVASAFQASFLACAFVDAVSAADVPEITGISVRVHDSSDRLLEENAWFIPPSHAAPTPAVASDHAAAKAAVARRFRDGARRIGAELKSVSFTELPRLVPDATIRIKNPQALVSNAPVLLSKIIGADEGYDGRIIRVVDLSGDPVGVWAYNFRTRSGEVWINPNYEASYPGTMEVVP